MVLACIQEATTSRQVSFVIKIEAIITHQNNGGGVVPPEQIRIYYCCITEHY